MENLIKYGSSPVFGSKSQVEVECLLEDEETFHDEPKAQGEIPEEAES